MKMVNFELGNEMYVKDELINMTRAGIEPMTS